MSTEAFLQSLVKDGKLLHDNLIDEYVGFLHYHNSDIKFVPMGLNRIVNHKIVDQRVQENIDYYNENGKYLKFSTVKLIVVREDPDKFYVLDGQHRICTAQILCRQFQERELIINVSITVVNTHHDANHDLILFQKQYQPDSRMFCSSPRQKEAITNVITLFRECFPNAFRLYDNYITECRSNTHVSRPHLNDPLVAYLYNKVNLLKKEDLTKEDIYELNKYVSKLNFKKKTQERTGFGFLGNIRDTEGDVITSINQRFIFT